MMQMVDGVVHRHDNAQLEALSTENTSAVNAREGFAAILRSQVHQ